MDLLLCKGFEIEVGGVMIIVVKSLKKRKRVVCCYFKSQDRSLTK